MNYDIDNIARDIRYNRTCQTILPKMDFHLHNDYEIYFFVSGNVNYFIEKGVYQLKYGNLLIMNSNEIHKSSPEEGEPYERIVIHFKPYIAKIFSSSDFDLSNCFINRDIGKRNLMILNEEQITHMLLLYNKLENILNNVNFTSILKVSCFVELLVYLNIIFNDMKYKDEHNIIPRKLIPVLEYIEQNPEQDLSLKKLEEKFFINRFYLSKLFKKTTGSGIHEYIMYKRISRAKTLLTQDHSVTETCSLSGFSDYSHFIRIFKRTVGISPGKYHSYIKQNSTH